MDIDLVPQRGLRLSSPLIAASGTFGYGLEFGEHADFLGLGAIICKGTTPLPRTGNTPVRMTETPAGMLNAIGLQNIGIDAVIAEKAPRWCRLGLPVLVNISGNSVEEYREMAERLDGIPGVSGIEVNISCPNVKEGGVAFGTSPRGAAEVTAAVRAATTLPVMVKLSPNVSDIRSIAAAVEAAGADAVSLINTVYGMAIDVRRRAPVLASVSGGLSGPAVKPLALYLVFQVAQEVGIPVVGLGGIMRADDVLEFLLAGATAVQLGTALLIDPAAWRPIAAELTEWCRREGVRDLTEIIGAANPARK